MQGDPKGSCSRPQVVWLGEETACPFQHVSNPELFSVFTHNSDAPPPPADLYVLPDTGHKDPEALLKRRDELLFPVLFLVRQAWLEPIVAQLNEYDDVTIWGAPSRLLEVRVTRLIHHCRALGVSLEKLQVGSLGLPLRTVFENSASYMLNQRTDSQPISCVYLDIDRCKELNNQYGYSVGDQVLEMWAQTLRDWTSDDCVVTRWGSDSFVVVGPMSGEQAEEAVQRLTETLANNPYRIKMFSGKEYTIPISISAGVAVATEIIVDLESFVHQGRLACYQVKRSKGL